MDTIFGVVQFLIAIISVHGADVGYGGECNGNDDVCTVTGTACIDNEGLKCLCDGNWEKAESQETCQCKAKYFLNLEVCLGEVGAECTDVSDCLQGGVCDNTCDCGEGYVTGTTGDTKCLKEVGAACEEDSDCLQGGVCGSACDCGEGYVTGTTGDTKCLKEVGAACEEDSDCLQGGVCGSTCDCGEGYVTGTTGDTKCLKEIGGTCVTDDDCGEGVCDTNAESATCALGSGSDCDAENSKCVIFSECTDEMCTCTNGDADENTKLCPAPSGGLRETCSMLVAAVCLWFNLF